MGKTSRSFKSCFMERNKSVLNRDSKSALNEHVRVCSCVSIEDFDVDILQRAETGVDVVLLEAQLISRRCRC